MPYDELASLSCDRSVPLLDELVALRAWLTEWSPRVADALHPIIGSQTGPVRGALLTLRRDLFNRRRTHAHHRRLLRALATPELYHNVVTVAWRLRRERRLVERTRAVMTLELVESRRRLHSLSATPEFRKALQLASPALATSLEQYLRSDPAAPRARDRQIEIGLLHYLVRMTAKTSPLGRYGPVALGRVEADEAGARVADRPDRPGDDRPIVAEAPAWSTHSTVSLRLGTLSLIAASLARHPQLRPHLPVWLNASLIRSEDSLSLRFTRPRAVWDETVTIVRGLQRQVRVTPALQRLIDLVCQQPMAEPGQRPAAELGQRPVAGLGQRPAAGLGQRPAAELGQRPVAGLCLHELQHAYQAAVGAADAASRQQADAFVETTITAGLIEIGFRLPSDAPDRLAQLIDQVAGLEERLGLPATLTAALTQLEAIRQQVGTATVAERQALLATAQRVLDELLQWRMPLPFEGDEVATPFVEDTRLNAATARLGPPFWQALMADLGQLLDCLAARDLGGSSAAWLRDLFVMRYGEGGYTPSLLEFAADYRRGLDQLMQRAAATQFTDPTLQRAAQAQRRLMEYAVGLASGRVSEDGEIVIDPSRLHQLMEEWGGATTEPLSVGLHLQVVAASPQAIEEGNWLVVFNQALPGFGRFFGRYCQLFPEAGPTGQSLADQLQECLEWLRQAWPADQELIEVLSVLDHNAQLHPTTTPRQLVPPPEWSGRPDLEQLAAGAVGLRHDPLHDRLELSLPAAEPGGLAQRLTPLYLGFFHLIALPSLHRVLAELSPARFHPEGLRPVDLRIGGEVATTVTGQPASGVQFFPRLRLGRLVLQRATWCFAATALPDLSTTDALELWLTLAEWRRRYALPREIFVRVHRTADALAHGSLAADHKPLLIDFNNLLTLRVLRHLLRSGAVAELQVEEMLPNPRQLSGLVNGQAVVTEWQIELNRGRL